MLRFLFFPLLLLAGCQPLPHPFAENHPPPLSPLMSPPDAVGIVVDPITGAPALAATALAAAMVASLHKEDVPADPKIGNHKSYRLTGSVNAQTQGGRTHATVDWRLTGSDGRIVGEETVSHDMPQTAWEGGDKEAIAVLVAGAAPALAKRVEGDVPMEKAIHEPVIAVAAVTGAPGDGGRSLSLAIGDSLHRAGIVLKGNSGDKENFRLAARVQVGPAQGGKQDVKIVWSLSGADGGEIGRVNQENAVPAGSLDGAWGDTAFDVALAATGGIVELIQRAQAPPSG